MLRVIFGVAAFAVAMWAGSARAQAGDFVVTRDQVADHAPLPFVSDDPNPALHRHGGSGNAAMRASYLRAEAAFAQVTDCLTPDGHPQGHFDLTRVNWAHLQTEEAVEVCVFRLLNIVGTDRIAAYFTALGFDVTQGPSITRVISHDTNTIRTEATWNAGLKRDRSWGSDKAANQALFDGTLLPRAASIDMSIAQGEIVFVSFGLTTL